MAALIPPSGQPPASDVVCKASRTAQSSRIEIDQFSRGGGNSLVHCYGRLDFNEWARRFKKQDIATRIGWLQLSSLLCAGFLFSKKKNLLLLFALISTASIGCQLLSAAANYQSLHLLDWHKEIDIRPKFFIFISHFLAKLWQHFSRRALIMAFHFPLAFPAENLFIVRPIRPDCRAFPIPF